MNTATMISPPAPDARAAPPPPVLDAFIPRPEVRERFQTIVHAPAAVVMDAARTLDLQSLRIVRTIFRLRELIMRASPPPRTGDRGLLAETLSLGWGVLKEEPDRLIACGAVTQPWLADVVFTPIPAGEFAAFDKPDQVKIAWTLEVQPLGPALTVFAHETRVVGTDAVARAKFRRYWRWARFGIIGIRLLVMPAVRREAERRFRGERTS